MATAPQDTTRTVRYVGDPIFKGCTRPAMLFGVPVVPCILVCGAILLLAVWFSFWLIALAPVALLIMRQVTKTDDQMFRLLGLKFRFRVAHLNRNGRFWRASAYAPIAFTKRKSR